MLRFHEFMKTTILGGLFAILPLILIVELAAKAYGLAEQLTTPLGKLLPEALSDATKFPIISAVVFVLIACFSAGLILRFRVARASGKWIERYLLMYTPGYRILRGLIQGIVGSETGSGFRPALLKMEHDEMEFACIIEDHGNGWSTVMLPSSPSMLSGTVKIVRSSNLEVLNVKLTDVASVLGQWGAGTKKLLEMHRERNSASV
ncbi:MAG TPA: hypothetical protein PLJ47_00330 [Candidatus Hydrogenedentes bacterium]|nr:hypothetical protein [Candidatus Hydrogenedentota bacterium]HRK33008.1 hypothetical protein [Candidatus Hydrogenedentota bacterium]